jgi:hypothetical protein
VQNIPILLAASGMVTAKEVMRPDNPEGFPVCGKGTTLSESLVERLKSMGVQSITVEGHPVEMEGEVSTAEKLAALDKRFRKISGDPVMAMVKEKFRNHIIQSGNS